MGLICNSFQPIIINFLKSNPNLIKIDLKWCLLLQILKRKKYLSKLEKYNLTWKNLSSKILKIKSLNLSIMDIIKKLQSQSSSNIASKTKIWISLMECIKDSGKILSKQKKFASTKFTISTNLWLVIYLSFNKTNVVCKVLKWTHII